MKSVIGVLALLLAIGASSAAISNVQIWGDTTLYGTAQFSQVVQNGGPDWQKVGDVSSGGWINPTQNKVDMIFANTVTNIGTTQIQKYIDTQGDWDVRGIDNMLLTPALGTTGTIWKTLNFDTNSKYVVDDPTKPNYGKLESPTKMLAVDTLTFDSINAYQQGIDVTLDLPPAQKWSNFDFTATFNTPLGVNEIFAKNKAPIKNIPNIPAPVPPMPDP